MWIRNSEHESVKHCGKESQSTQLKDVQSPRNFEENHNESKVLDDNKDVLEISGQSVALNEVVAKYKQVSGTRNNSM